MLSSISSGWAGSNLRRRWCGRALWLCGRVLLATAAAAETGDSALTPRQKAMREIAIAEAASRAASQLRRHPDFRAAIARDAEIAPVLEQAQRVLNAARNGLARAEQTGSATAFSDSAALGRRATSTFEDYQQKLRQQFARIQAERAPPPPPPPLPLETEPPAVAAPSPPPPVASSPPSRSPRRPSAKLRQAANAYFAGDYETAITLLESRFTSRKSRAHALLLRAAARYALFLLGGETDYAQRGTAAEDVAACRRADPSLEPAEDLFSPRFRDFFAATR